MDLKGRRVQPALDEKWFGTYQGILGRLGETYTALEPFPEKVDAARLKFERSGFKASPDLRTDRIDPAMIESLIPDLTALQDAIRLEEPNEYVRLAYEEAIREFWDNINLILAASKGDYKAVQAANDALYGRPDNTYFASVCQWIREDATATVRSGTPAAGFIDAVLDLVPDKTCAVTLIPDEAVFQKVRRLHHTPGGFYDVLFGADSIPEQAYIEQSAGDEICRRALRNIRSDYTLAYSENNIWSTDRHERLLMRPKGYRLDRDEFIGIVSHEIGTHILDAVNGSSQPLLLLGLGLAGYVKTNEGRAFLREQIVYEHESVFLKQFSWEYIVLLYLSVALTQGLNGRPYTFSELYEVVYALYRFWRERRNPFGTNNEQFARDEAWYLAARIFKGTEGVEGAYAKDSVYLEGNLRCWEIAAKNPEVILMGDLGKFNINDGSQIDMLKGLGIVQ